MGDTSQYSSLFPKLRVRDITGIKVKILQNTSDGEREFDLATLRPDSTEDDVSDVVGDGVFKLEAYGMPTDNRPPMVLELREIALAVGREPLWKDRVRSAMSGADADDDLPPHRGRSPLGGRMPMRSFDDEEPEPSDLGGLGGGPPTRPMDALLGRSFSPMGASGDPVIVPLGPDENLPLARGLSPEEQQRRIDEARAERRSRTEDSQMIKEMMNVFAQNARAAEERAARVEERAAKAEEQSRDMMIRMLSGAGSAGSAAAQPVLSPSASEYKEMLEERRSHVRELEDRLAQARRDADERERFWREHAAALERRIWEKDGEIARLQGDLKMKEIQAQVERLAASGGLDTQKAESLSTEDKIKMAMGVVQTLGPALGPILKQLGLGGAPGLPPGMDGGGGMGGGSDLPGT